MAVGSVGGTYGLSGSGLDIDTLVNEVNGRAASKRGCFNTKENGTQWQKTAYNTVYDDISKFRDTVNNINSQTLNPNKASSSNTAVATVTANAHAVDVSHSLWLLS